MRSYEISLWVVYLRARHHVGYAVDRIYTSLAVKGLIYIFVFSFIEYKQKYIFSIITHVNKANDNNKSTCIIVIKTIYAIYKHVKLCKIP